MFAVIHLSKPEEVSEKFIYDSCATERDQKTSRSINMKVNRQRQIEKYRSEKNEGITPNEGSRVSLLTALWMLVLLFPMLLL